MIRTTLDILGEIVVSQKDNFIAKELLVKLKNEDWELIKNNLHKSILSFSLTKVPDQEYKVDTADNSVGGDYRFKNFCLNSFRKYPPGAMYGLSFERKEYPNNSLFMVGDNGSGKTSLFSAVEYLCLGRISAAQMRGYTKSELPSYIRNAESEASSHIYIECNHALLDNTVPMPDGFAKIQPLLRPFFCSENDIVQVGQNADGLEDFMYEQLGLKETLELRAVLQKSIDYLQQQLKDSNDNYINETKRELKKHKFRLKFLKKIQSESVLFFIYWGKDIKKLCFLPNSFTHKDTSFLKRNNDESENDYVSKVKEGINGYKQALESELERVTFSYSNDNQLAQLYRKQIEKCKRILDSNQLDVFPIELYNTKQQEFVTRIQNLNIQEFESERDFYVEEYNKLFQAFQQGDKDKILPTIILDLLKEQNGIESYITEQEQNLDQILNFSKDVYDEKYKNINSLIKGIDEQVQKRTKLILKDSKDLLVSIMDDFLMPYEQFDIVESDNGINARITFTDDKGRKHPLAPREYFNSFRYKLYCVSLKIAVAFIMKELFGINFPLVFDDVFYSSDFTNRDRVCNFIRNIYQCHDRIFGDEESKRLQMIFFTHDDMIVEAAQRCTYDMDDVINARLFDYRECMEGDERKLDSYKYMNLYLNNLYSHEE